MSKRVVNPLVHPGRDDVAAAIAEKRERLKEPPKKYKPLSEQAQLERQLHLANLAMNKYEAKLEKGQELELDEERMFLAHQDSIRKLETTLSALRSKADLTKKSDADLAKEMVLSGMDKEQVLALYEGNQSVETALEKL